MKKAFKKIPRFKNEDEERAFWSTHDSTPYVDWSKVHRGIFPNLKPTSRLISIRFPLSILDQLKALANKQDLPYQSLIKTFVTKGLAKRVR